MGRKNRRYTNSDDHALPMASTVKPRVHKDKPVNKRTWASEVTISYSTPRPQRLSREELRELETVGTIMRRDFEYKRAYR